MALSFATRVWLADAAERIFWTAVQAVAATLIVLIAGLDPLLIAVVTPLLTALKTLAARKVGNPVDASTLRF